MMAVDGLFKEFGDVFGRLFDHRPVLQGEIGFFQREFEEKRGNREETRLLKCLEYGKEINAKLIPQIIESLKRDFPKFSMSVTEAVSRSQEIIDKENQSVKTEWLEQRRLQRSSDWSGFLNTMTSKVSDVDTEFADEVALVTVHYEELEEKLKITDRKERTEIAHQKETRIEKERVGTSQTDTAEVVKDGVTVSQEVKVGDGPREGDGVEIMQKDDAVVDCSEKIAKETERIVEENNAEVNSGTKIAMVGIVRVGEHDKTEILSNSETSVKERKEIDTDTTETD